MSKLTLAMHAITNTKKVLISLAIITSIPLISACVGNAHSQKAQQNNECKSENSLDFVCGLNHIEDLIQIPERNLLIGSSGVGPGSLIGKIVLIDTKNRKQLPLSIVLTGEMLPEYANCPRPPNLDKLHPHGISIRPGENNQHLLYLVNHVDRESVEHFNVDASNETVKVTWVGCTLLPDGAYGNGVVPLPDGGFVVTKFYDTRESNMYVQLGARTPNGVIYRWHPPTTETKAHFTTIKGSESFANNGLEITADGKWLFMNLWTQNKTIRFDLAGDTPPKSIPLAFMPDNIHRAPDGTMLIGGHVSTIELLLSCKANCLNDWAVARLDPNTLEVSYLLWEKGSKTFADTTGAIELNNELWLSVYRGDRVAVVPVPASPIQ